MKFKKSWIFWICYYGAAITANVLAAVLLRDRWNFNGWSAFPIFFTAISIFWLFFFSSKFAANYFEELHIKDRLYFDKNFDEAKYRAYAQAREQDETVKKNSAAARKFFTGFTLLCIPFFWMYILFFANYIKAFSWLIPGIAYIIVGLVWFSLHDDGAEIKKQRAKELKEQQEREELGKWR